MGWRSERLLHGIFNQCKYWVTFQTEHVTLEAAPRNDIIQYKEVTKHFRNYAVNSMNRTREFNLAINFSFPSWNIPFSIKSKNAAFIKFVTSALSSLQHCTTGFFPVFTDTSLNQNPPNVYTHGHSLQCRRSRLRQTKSCGG